MQAVKMHELVRSIEETTAFRSAVSAAYDDLLTLLSDLGSKNDQIKNRLIEEIQSIREISEPFIRSEGRLNESRTCAAFDALISLGVDVFPQIEGGDVVSNKREYSFPCGRVDRLLFHKDGSVTIVEIKQKGSRRDIAQAIGQVIMYGAAAKRFLKATDFHLAICVSGDRDEWIEAACEMAGVAYLTISDQCHAVVDAAARGYLLSNTSE